jgi:hypothetical protein
VVVVGGSAPPLGSSIFLGIEIDIDGWDRLRAHQHTHTHTHTHTPNQDKMHTLYIHQYSIHLRSTPLAKHPAKPRKGGMGIIRCYR